MRALLVTCLIATLVSAGSLLGYWVSRRPAPRPLPPGVVYIEQPVVDFGRVGLNKAIGGTFTVVNGSDRTVTLSEVGKSCACTSAEVSASVLAPSERATVSFQVRTGDRRGGRAESIVVQFNSPPDEQAERLFAKVMFIPTGVFDVSPPQVVLTSLKPKAEITVLSDSATGGQKVLRVESRHPCVKVNASRLPAITLELDPDVASESVVNTECLIYTTVVGEEAIAIPVRVRK